MVRGIHQNAVLRYCLIVGGLGLVAACDPVDDEERTELVDPHSQDASTRPAGVDEVTATPSEVAQVPGFDATIVQNGADIDLSWIDQGPGSTYDVWRSGEPYFRPGDPGATLLVSGVVGTAYTDVGGNDANSYYYRIESTAGPNPGYSTTLGKFVQPLIVSGWTLLGFPLLDSGNRDAESLGLEIQGALEVWRWGPHLRYYTAYNPSPVWNAPNFTWVEGEAVAVLTDGTSGTTYTQVGVVPVADDISLTLPPGVGNVVTVPLSQVATDAIGLAAQVPTITQLDDWNTTTQGFDNFYAPMWGTNFPIEPGGGLWVYVNDDTPWPDVPHPSASFVNAGAVAQSTSYRLVWSFGQETQNQNTMDSTSYTLRGGHIASIASD